MMQVSFTVNSLWCANKLLLKSRWGLISLIFYEEVTVNGYHVFLVNISTLEDLWCTSNKNRKADFLRENRECESWNEYIDFWSIEMTFFKVLIFVSIKIYDLFLHKNNTNRKKGLCSWFNHCDKMKILTNLSKEVKPRNPTPFAGLWLR